MRLIEIYEQKDKHFAAPAEQDASYNPESSLYRDEEEKDSKKRRQCKCDGECACSTPIIVDDEDNGEPDWTSSPEKGESQSAGYRGREEAKANAGMPHDKYQKYDPNYFYQENPVDFR